MFDDLNIDPDGPFEEGPLAIPYAFGPVSLSLELAGFVADERQRLSDRLACVRLEEGDAAGGPEAPVGCRLRAIGLHPLRYDDHVHAAAGGEWVLRHDFTLVRDETAWLGECLSFALSAEYALRWAVAIELLARDGLLLHASSVRVAGGAHVVLGASGVGKSTIAFEGDFDGVFSDELSIVAPDPATGTWTVWPSPFWGQLRQPERLEAAPLAGIWVLDGRERTATAPLGDAEGVLALFSRVIDIAAAEATNGLALGLLSELVEAVPVRRLAWRRGDPLAAALRVEARPIFEVSDDDLILSDDVDAGSDGARPDVAGPELDAAARLATPSSGIDSIDGVGDVDADETAPEDELNVFDFPARIRR